eukprot:COSAG04_NODE_661_length_11448_cov_24.495903_1_plen_1474_part_00
MAAKRRGLLRRYSPALATAMATSPRNRSACVFLTTLAAVAARGVQSTGHGGPAVAHFELRGAVNSESRGAANGSRLTELAQAAAPPRAALAEHFHELQAGAAAARIAQSTAQMPHPGSQLRSPGGDDHEQPPLAARDAAATLWDPAPGPAVTLELELRTPVDRHGQLDSRYKDDAQRGDGSPHQDLVLEKQDCQEMQEEATSNIDAEHQLATSSAIKAWLALPLLLVIFVALAAVHLLVELRSTSQFGVTSPCTANWARWRGVRILGLLLCTVACTGEQSFLLASTEGLQAYQGFTRVTSGSAVERTDWSNGGIAFDADGDGDQDVMVFNAGEGGTTNEMLINDGAGVFTRVTSGSAVERTDWSNGGIAFDADGDGDQDVMVFNSDAANELLISDGAGGFTRVTSGAAVERTDASDGGIAFDADGDGDEDVMVFNFPSYNEETDEESWVGGENELLINDGAGGFTRVTSGPAVERTDRSNGGIAFDATGDGTADDVMVFNDCGERVYDEETDEEICVGGENELLINDGAGGFTRVTSGPAVERADDSCGGIAFDATGDGTADDVMVVNGGENELLINDGAGSFTRAPSNPAAELQCGFDDTGTRMFSFATFDANGDGSTDIIAPRTGGQGGTNQLLLGDGVGGFAQVAGGAAIERSDASFAAMAFDANGDGVQDVMVFNAALLGKKEGTPQANELLLGSGAVESYTRVTGGALASSQTERGLGAFAFDANGDGLQDIFGLGGEPQNQLLLNDGAGGFTPAATSPLVDVPDDELYAIGFDADGDGTGDLMVLGQRACRHEETAPDQWEEVCEPGEDQLLLNDGAGGFIRAPTNPRQTNRDGSQGIAFDADGDGDKDVMVLGGQNELLLNDGAGGFMEVASGPAVERTDESNGGIAFDATGDGTADDVMVFNNRRCEDESWYQDETTGEWRQEARICVGGHNELLINDGAGGFTRVTSGAAVERADDSYGGIAFDATGDGTPDDVMVFNGDEQENELLINDGSGGFTRVTSGPAVERAAREKARCTGVAFDATGDGTPDDVMIFNEEQNNELLINDGAGGFTRVASGPLASLVEDSVGVHSGLVFDATGDGTADDVMLFAGYDMESSEVKLFVRGFCSSPELAALRLGFVQVEGSTTCYTCPAYSTGTLRSMECEYCPAGRVGPSDQSGEAIPGWRHDQRYACGACAAGKFRAETQQTEYCTDCAVGLYSEAGFGECLQCEVGRVTSLDGVSPSGPAQGATSCVACPPGQTSSLGSTVCKCEAGRYNSSAVLPSCHTGEYQPGSPQEDGPLCRSCDQLECVVDCQGDWLRIDTGWSPLPTSGRDLPIFTCKYNLSGLPPSCPGGVLSSNNSTGCADGYDNPLCGACKPDFTLKSDGSCEPCGLTSATSAIIVGIVALVALVVLVKTLPIWFNYFTILQELVALTQSMELKPISKMVVATMQILGNLAGVLSIRLPEIFTSFLASLVSFFKCVPVE